MSDLSLNPRASQRLRTRGVLVLSVLALSLSACTRPVLRAADPVPVATTIPTQYDAPPAQKRRLPPSVGKTFLPMPNSSN